MKNNFLFALSLLLSLLGGKSLSAQKNPANYNWLHPEKVWVLEDTLNEISGLSMTADNAHLLEVEDETGNVYQLNPTTMTLQTSVPFWKEGDYEGVEAVGDSWYVVKNTGTIYAIHHPCTPQQETIKYNTLLTDHSDVEGLGYDPIRHALLLACKASSTVGGGSTEERAVFAFNLSTHTLDTVPFLVFNQAAVQAYLDTCAQKPAMEKINEIFSEEAFSFHPTAIAVHPLNGHLYLSSSKGNLLFVANREGHILHIIKLPKTFHRQPEGICFDNHGNLYISNEKRKDNPACIVMYRYLVE
ncbi:MAG: SdiA-regulated domain-containing protein [Saprospiraceae bacterium]